MWRLLGRAGVFGLRLAEDHPSGAGAGLGPAETVLIFEEAGRALVPGPLVATHLAAGLVEGAATGDAVVTVLDLSGTGRPPHTPAGEGASVLVEHLAAADAVLVVDSGTAYVLPVTACASDAASDVVSGLASHVVSGVGPGATPGTLAGFAAEPMRSVDPLTPLHRVSCAAVAGPGPDTAPGEDPRLPEPLTLPGETIWPREAVLLTAALQLGSAGRTVEMAVRYAGEREQFGQPIGAFQAVKHLCAQMLVRAELARSAVYAAAVTGNADDTAVAKLLADEAAVRNARDCLQVHGGMGFTWEADVHLHLKRAWLRAGQWQSAAESEEALAESLLAAEDVAG
ncbi:acyl-CoA dehydrogenase [Streptomyces sp. NPDC004647]|uniref:acyl-CoA dehydrogenase n=1 Tax=Streptomyces sp. NPDC004647 TaxID=3154671 RepID=UPI0033A97996